MTVEYIFTKEQRDLLDKIEEARLMAMEPFEMAALEINAGSIRPPLWKLADLDRQMVADNMMFARMKARVYALVLPHITMTREEYRKSTIFPKGTL